MAKQLPRENDGDLCGICRRPLDDHIWRLNGGWLLRPLCPEKVKENA